jgi:hypothetical protein
MTTQNIQDSEMTKACLVDLLKQHLASIESQEEGKYDNRRYYDQAHNLLITDAFKPVPYFIIYLSELIIELYDLCSRDRAFVRARYTNYTNGLVCCSARKLGVET